MTGRMSMGKTPIQFVKTITFFQEIAYLIVVIDT